MPFSQHQTKKKALQGCIFPKQKRCSLFSLGLLKPSRARVGLLNYAEKQQAQITPFEQESSGPHSAGLAFVAAAALAGGTWSTQDESLGVCACEHDGGGKDCAAQESCVTPEDADDDTMDTILPQS